MNQHNSPTAPVGRPAPLEGYEPWNASTRPRLRRLMRRHFRHHGRRQLVTLSAIFTASTGIVLYLAGGWGPPARYTNTLVDVLLLVATFAGWIVILYLVLPHISVGLIRRQERRGWVVGYFSDHAAQLVHPRGGRWFLGDHFALPGHGRALRCDVIPHLALQADRHGIEIELETSSLKLARMYQQEVPSLSDPQRLQRGWFRKPIYLQRRGPQGQTN